MIKMVIIDLFFDNKVNWVVILNNIFVDCFINNLIIIDIMKIGIIGV